MCSEQTLLILKRKLKDKKITSSSCKASGLEVEAAEVDDLIWYTTHPKKRLESHPDPLTHINPRFNAEITFLPEFPRSQLPNHKILLKLKQQPKSEILASLSEKFKLELLSPH